MFLIVWIAYRTCFKVYPDIPDWTPLSTVETEDLKIVIPKQCLYLFIHCTANKAGSNITKANGKAYLWRIAMERNFPTYGYNWIIYEDGQIDTLVAINNNNVVEPFEKVCGVAGYNSRSWSVAYMGGLNWLGFPAKTLTPAAEKSLNFIINRVKTINYKIKVCPHNKFNTTGKACPSYTFDCF